MDSKLEKRFTVAILLNALVLPGTGHFYLGKKTKGLVIALATTLLIFLPLYRYSMTAFYTIQLASAKSSDVMVGLNAMSSAWAIHRSMILWAMVGVLLLWIYAIADLIILKNQNSKIENQNDN